MKNSFSFHRVQVNNELISINQRLLILEGNINTSTNTISVIAQPNRASPTLIEVHIEMKIVPNIIKAKTVRERVEQYCNGWDNILPLKVWKIHQ